MFEQFSSGYYLGRLYVSPHDGDRPVMNEADHEQVNEQLYADGEGVERLDLPLVMKIGPTHLAVHGAAGIPERTVALPRGLLDDTRTDNPPSLREVLLAKADRAAQLLGIPDEPPV